MEVHPVSARKPSKFGRGAMSVPKSIQSSTQRVTAHPPTLITTTYDCCQITDLCRVKISHGEKVVFVSGDFLVSMLNCIHNTRSWLTA
jgi:hypothetical protein